MKRFAIPAFAAAMLFHGGALLFGGLLLFHPEGDTQVREDVELVADTGPDDAKADEKKEDQAKPEQAPDESEREDAIREQIEALPDLRALAALDAPAAAPALAAMSLSDLESALGGGSGAGGEFAGGFSLSSGGRIGGTGVAGAGGGSLDDILSAAELDQKPHPVFQAAPQYPLELRRKKVEGTVHVVFLVDKEGQVLNPHVENSTHPAFERPALEAVRRWRFEAGTRNGHKVSFKMRVPISFHAS